MNYIGAGTTLPQRVDPAGPLATPIEIATAPGEGQTLSGLLLILRHRWKLVALVTLATFAVGLAACLLITPRYAATSTLEINKDDHGQDTAAQSSGPTFSADEIKTELQTDVSVLESDGMALAVMQDLHLLERKPFNRAVAPGEKGKPLDQAPRTRERAVQLFSKYLKVDTPADTRLITVTYQNPDPALAAAISNSLCDKFIENSASRRQRSTARVSVLLQKQLADLKKQVEISEQKLADYERKTGMAGIQLTGASSGEGSSSVAISPHNTVDERLFALNQELTTAEANRISTETVYRLVQTQDPEVVLGLGSMSASSGSGGAGSVSSDAGIQLVRSLRAEEASLSQEFASASVKYGTGNPRLSQLQGQLDAVRTQMKAELNRISRRAENAYTYAKKNEDTIRAQFGKQQSAANEMADKTVQLQVLAQEAYSNRALYESLFSKLQTASLASGVRATRIDVVDEARVPGSPSVPDYGRFLPVIAGVGVLFGVSSAFLRESLDDTVRTPRDVGEVTNLSMLAYVPNAGETSLKDGRAGESRLIEAPHSPFSEAFRTLRTSILLETAAIHPKVFLVTSPIGNDGKTTVTYNLGVAFAQGGARVLLIDADLRHPSLHRAFGCPVAPGVGDLQGAAPGTRLPGIVRHTTVPTLSILPAGHQLDFPAEFFESAEFAGLLHTCAQQFDYVLIDSPPMLAVADASIIATKGVAGVLAVIRSGSTTRPTFSAFATALQRVGTPIIGVLLNDVRNPPLYGFHAYSYHRQKSGAQHVQA